ncbi:hypothetical protein SRHO_G00279170 [Serrasalmus rhombeus]
MGWDSVHLLKQAKRLPVAGTSGVYKAFSPSLKGESSRAVGQEELCKPCTYTEKEENEFVFLQNQQTYQHFSEEK